MELALRIVLVRPQTILIFSSLLQHVQIKHVDMQIKHVQIKYIYILDRILFSIYTANIWLHSQNIHIQLERGRSRLEEFVPDPTKVENW